MNIKTEEDVLKIVKEKNVSFIQFWFTDVLGILKSFAVTPSELEMGLSEGMGFDGSSIEGFARIQESDMIAKPDIKTFAFVPWRQSEDAPVARMSALNLNTSISKTTRERNVLMKGDILTRVRLIWGAISEEAPYLPCKIWESRWNTATTRLRQASMK